MMAMFRNLNANEIECKVSMINEKGLSLLLYKTARTDMQLLDETVGPYNWQCEYQEIKGNMYCGISIYDTDKKYWITKWDCGVESAFGDKEKGEASDSFKRAGFKWGIGTELYTSPFIYVPAEKTNILKQIVNGKTKYATTDKFYVEKIEVTNNEITALEIKKRDKNKTTVFTYNTKIKK